jgi:hypothetical protein
VTIQNILASTTAPSVIGLDRPKAGTVNVFLWTASKALISRNVTEVTKAFRNVATLDADGTFNVLATEAQLEMVAVIMAEFAKIQSGELACVKERKEMDGVTSAVSAFNTAARKRAEYEF